MPVHRPIIGITADAQPEKFLVGRSYVSAVVDAGGLPLVLPCRPDLAEHYVRLCDAILLTGGNDPIMSQWNTTTHPKANPVDPQRQEFELAVLRALDNHALKPALGICLGMQYMGLHNGGTLNQHLSDTLPTAAEHWDRRTHEIDGELGSGIVHSHHRQALSDAGGMRVIATSADGVIEAVKRDDRPFYFGVQWHPERTDDPELGLGIIRQLVDAARIGRRNKIPD